MDFAFTADEEAFREEIRQFLRAHMCVDYAKVREQSGRPIGAFQAIQHHCADMLRNVEGSRYILGEACLEGARKGHQILGAIGYCEEPSLHWFHKRIQAASLDCGDAGLHLETVAQAIGVV